MGDSTYDRSLPNLERLEKAAKGLNTPAGRKWNQDRPGYKKAAKLTKMLRSFGIEAATDDEMGWSRRGKQTGVAISIRTDEDGLIRLDPDIIIRVTDQLNSL